MITFICCSIDPTMAAQLNENIAQHIELPYELIIHDNRGDGYGICKVYNDCAKDAKYEYLCFLHEDVRFRNSNWAATMVEKLNEPDCGVIGFAGSQVKYKLPSGWGCLKEASRVNVIQKDHHGTSNHEINNPHNERFAQVVTLDGLCMFVRKGVWEQYKFDQVLLDRFHCYDLDFALAVAQSHKNYVCFTLDIEHLSLGSYNQQWCEATKKLHAKWESRLPMCTPEWSAASNTADQARFEYRVSRYTMKMLHSICSPTHIATSHFGKYWYKSHYAWLIIWKLMTDKLKRR